MSFFRFLNLPACTHTHENVDSGNMSLTVEKLIPMDDGLWQVLCFWDTDEPEVEDPAWIQQDNLLVRVPEL